MGSHFSIVTRLKVQMNRIEAFDCPMDVATIEETASIIAERVESNIFTQHVVVNVAKLVNMRKDDQLSQSIRSSDIINIDGMGVVIAARILGFDVPERVAGIDLFHSLLKMSAEHGYPVYLLGAENVVVTEACHRLEKLYPCLIIAGHHHGYFWDDEAAMARKIHDSGARLLFVAITSPKKENFINKWKDELNVDFVMGVGGTFDVVSGKTKRAPVWMQDYGMEWLYRVFQEPGRMWKRYLVTNSRFLVMLCQEKVNQLSGKK
jgi:N-acetylglucosaminyldiphosphoundecaprenol N-acetyl-beta-D-mannosaminyltransferase